MIYSEQAFAKVNLYLQVVARRENGYHELDSLVVFAKTGDRLETKHSEGLHLEIIGKRAKGLSNDDSNLVLKAARKLQIKAGISKGAHLILDKSLPIEAGIGGGSSDAAATLRLLERFWGLDIPEQEMLDIALDLGADVPVCYKSKAMIMRGIGERLLSSPALPECFMVLVNPGIGLSTPDVFKAHPFNFLNERAFPQTKSFDEFIDALSGFENQLTAGALSLAPEISNVLKLIGSQEECALVRMSGSGSTCFGLFKKEETAQAAAKNIQNCHENWWVEAIPMIS